jgi:hypothetical protein
MTDSLAKMAGRIADRASRSERKSDLRSDLIRLAHARPEFRKDLLPILQATKDAGSVREYRQASVRREKKAIAILSGEITMKWAKPVKEAIRSLTGPRESWIPKDNPTLLKLHTPEGLEIYRWEKGTDRKGNPLSFAIAFAGKADKPIWYYTYTDQQESQLQSQIKETISNYLAIQAMKKKKQEERKNFQHGMNVGDILYSSWGYDQTNVDWYQITAVVGKSIVMREIAGKSVGSDKTVPQPGHFVGEPMKKIPQGAGSDRASVKINSFSYAYPWDGRPQYVTPSGYGH